MPTVAAILFHAAVQSADLTGPNSFEQIGNGRAVFCIPAGAGAGAAGGGGGFGAAGAELDAAGGGTKTVTGVKFAIGVSNVKIVVGGGRAGA